MKCFGKYYDTKLLTIKNKNIVLMRNEQSEAQLSRIGKNKRKCFWNKAISMLNKTDALYIRYSYSDPYFVRFLRQAKQMGKYVIVEFPTYPYIYESCVMNPKHIIMLLIDRAYFSYVKKLSDLFITFTSAAGLDSRKCIELENGIDVNEIRLKTRTEAFEDENRLDLIFIGNVSFWHGLDRVLKGIKTYISSGKLSPKVTLHIVGEGDELKKLKLLSDKLYLGDYVVFHGNLDGKELDELFDQCQVAIGSLGLHRKKIAKISSLKAREYCARGIPFIDSGEDDDFAKDFKYRWVVPADESEINLTDIFKFYKSLKGEHYNLVMRNYAIHNLDWSKKLEPIIKKIMESTNNLYPPEIYKGP